MKKDAKGRLIWGTCLACKKEVHAKKDPEALAFVCAECGAVCFRYCAICGSPTPHEHKAHTSGAVWPHYSFSDLRSDERLISDDEARTLRGASP